MAAESDEKDFEIKMVLIMHSMSLYGLILNLHKVHHGAKPSL